MQVLAHNLLSQFANRQLNITTDKKAKSAEKLSSGYKINRSADDAAGLSISEKMRWQIRGLSRASNNIKDGISLIQVADGALAETHELVQRINELSVQAANDINTDADRQAIQDEVEELLKEIDRIAESTEFNTQKVFQKKDTVISGGTLLAGKVSNFVTMGTPADDTITVYNIDANASSGISINGTTYAWNTITNANGQTLDTLSDGTYTITNNNLTFSFAINGMSDLVDVVNSLEDVTVTMKTQNNTATSVISISDKYNIPFLTIYNETYLKDSIYNQDVHTLTTDADGIILDNTYKIEWVDVYPPTTSDVMRLVFNENVSTGAAMWLEVALDANHTLDDIIDALDGVTFNSTPTGNIVTQNTGTQQWRDIGKYAGLKFDKIKIDAVGMTVTKLPTALFMDQGYDLDSVYINKRIAGEINLDLSDVPKTKMSFSIDGTKTTTFTLTAESQVALKKVIDRGGILAVGELLDLNFEFGGSIIPYQIEAKQELALSDVAKFLNTNNNGGYTGGDIIFYGAFTERDLEVEKLSFNNSGSTTGTSYSFTVTGLKNGNSTGNVLGSYKGWWIQSGATKGNGMILEIENMNTQILGIGGLDVSTGAEAQESIKKAQKAIDKLSFMRSKIGAQQNRLEYTMRNVNNIVENTQAAESRIRDTDMAKEMVEYSKHNILEQAGQSMLAQANQSVQGILSLMQ